MAKRKVRSRVRAAAKAKLERKSPRKAATAARRRAAARSRSRGQSARAKARAAAGQTAAANAAFLPSFAFPPLPANAFPVLAEPAFETEAPRTVTLHLAITLPSFAHFVRHPRVAQALFGWQQARRSLDRSLQRRLRALADLRLTLAHTTAIGRIRLGGRLGNLRRRIERTARRVSRLARSEAAFRCEALQRTFKRNLARSVRHGGTWFSRRAESKIYEAGNRIRRNVAPALAQLPPARRAAVAGAAAASAVALISIAALTLFNHATAVPNRQATTAIAHRTATVATAVDSADVWDFGPHSQKSALATIELPRSPYPVRETAYPQASAKPPVAATVNAQAEKSLARSVPDDQVSPDDIVPLPRPAPIKKAAPVKHERAQRHYPPHNSRHISPRVAREREAAARAAYASVDPSAGFGNSLVAEARRYLGTNPTGRSSLWCGAFMDLILRKTGHKGGGNLALGYEHYGTRVSGPEIGAIAVMGRRGGGHVGVVAGIDPNGNPIVISGNHNHTVAEAVYPRRRIITYVMPN